MMMWLLRLINPLGGVIKELGDAYIAKQNATTDQERIVADVKIKSLEARRDALVAEARSPINMIARCVLSAPPAVCIGKILIWDKAFGQWTGGHTDAIAPELWHVIMIVYGFYFLSEIASRIKPR